MTREGWEEAVAAAWTSMNDVCMSVRMSVTISGHTPGSNTYFRQKF